MIDPTCALASWFLWIAALVFLVASALPILFAPLWWARTMRWTIPQQTELAVYFARCVGGLTLAIVLIGMEAAPHPRAHPLIFDLIVAGSATMAAVHVWGAVRRQQPWTETLEIAFYVGLTALTVWVKRTL